MANTPQTQTPVNDFPLAYTPGFGQLNKQQIDEIRAQLIGDDGEPMDTPWHRAQMNLLIESSFYRFRDRDDFYVGGNMFIYYTMDQLRGKEFKGPDYFFVWGVERFREREYWWVVDENGKLPDVIIELLSKTTAKYDLTEKKDLYEKTFKTAEYFCYDPATKKLLGWRLVDGEYQPIEPNENGWLKSEQLGLWLGHWRGAFSNVGESDWIRFYDEDGELVLLDYEDERQKKEKITKQLEQKKAENKKLQARLAQLEEQIEKQG